jgi:ribonucleoside-diphosphate reductase alpha chain
MYLLKTSEGITIERPQHMYMRVALWVTKSFEEAVNYYNSLSKQLISPATPIIINSGTKKPQLASCVLTFNSGDSREGLLDTLKDISIYSSDAAGIGLCMSNIRSKESKLSSSGGYAGGLLKYLKIVNESLRFFNQQGRRPGSAAIYIEPWHKDIFDLLDIKKNTGAEELRARD